MCWGMLSEMSSLDQPGRTGRWQIDWELNWQLTSPLLSSPRQHYRERKRERWELAVFYQASNCWRTNYQAIENNIVSGDETPCVGQILCWWWSTVWTVLFVIIFVCVRPHHWWPEHYEIGSAAQLTWYHLIRKVKTKLMLMPPRLSLKLT